MSDPLVACGCLGAMYGEPYCACKMQQMGLQEMMEKNPPRIAEKERSALQMAEFFAKGGFDQIKRELNAKL